jgi:hypothetical protein
MNVYAQFGLEPIINTAGSIIADVTGAAAGWVTACAAAGLNERVAGAGASSTRAPT